MTSQKQISLFTEDESTYLQEASHVNPLALQVSNLEQKMTATSGRKCLELFERSPRSGSWAKTFAALLIGQGDWYSSRCRLTWKLKGTKSSRLYFQLVPSMLPTDGTGFGLLATPSSQPMADITPERATELGWKWTGTSWVRPDGSKVQSTLNHQVMMLPTPQARDEKNGSNITDGRFQRKLEEGRTIDLNDLARSGLLPTPVTSDATTGAIIGKNDTFKETSGLPRKVNQNGTDGSVGLARLVQLLPTPQATDFKGGATAESYEERGRGETNDLRTWAAFQERTGKTSQLNPLFVAEMMNFPVDWTLLPFLNGDKNQLRPTETP